MHLLYDIRAKMQVNGENKGGVLVSVEGLHGFVPFSELSKVGNLTLRTNPLITECQDHSD